MSRVRPHREAGQASVEYLVVAVGLLIALVVLTTVGGKQRCIDTFGGDLTDKVGTVECKDAANAVGAALTATVEELTFLINLPF